MEPQPHGEMTVTSDLDERYGIKKPTRNQRLAILRIKPYRRGKFFYISEEQLAILDEFDEYIKEHRTVEGFPLPAPSGPWEEEDSEEETAIAPVQQSGFTHAAQTNITEAPQQIETSELIHPQAPGANGYAAINPERMMQEALTRATEGLMATATAENLVNNPHLLPAHLQQQIAQYSNELKRKMPQPKSPDPMEMAQQILNKVRAYGLNP